MYALKSQYFHLFFREKSSVCPRWKSWVPTLSETPPTNYSPKNFVCLPPLGKPSLFAFPKISRKNRRTKTPPKFIPTPTPNSTPHSTPQTPHPKLPPTKKYPLPTWQGSILSLFSCKNASFFFDPCLSELNFDLRTSRDFLLRILIYLHSSLKWFIGFYLTLSSLLKYRFVVSW